MGNWSEQQDVRKDTKERDKSRRENLGKFFYDLAKLTFAAIVLGEVLNLRNDNIGSQTWYLIGIGAVFTYLLAWIGNKIFKY